MLDPTQNLFSVKIVMKFNYSTNFGLEQLFGLIDFSVGVHIMRFSSVLGTFFFLFAKIAEGNLESQLP